MKKSYVIKKLYATDLLGLVYFKYENNIPSSPFRLIRYALVVWTVAQDSSVLGCLRYFYCVQNIFSCALLTSVDVMKRQWRSITVIDIPLLCLFLPPNSLVVIVLGSDRVTLD